MHLKYLTSSKLVIEFNKSPETQYFVPVLKVKAVITPSVSALVCCENL
jgi:hypothetical protein